MLDIEHSNKVKQLTTQVTTAKKLSRRQFVGTAAAGAVVLGTMAGTGKLGGGLKALPVSAPASTRPNIAWDYEADVVCIGYGGAGATAAITACDSGASVIVLEKVPSLAALGVQSNGTPSYSISGGGGTTSMCDGSLVWVNNPTLGAIAMNALSGGATPMEYCQAWADEISQLPKFLTEMGVPFTGATSTTPSPEYPGLVDSSAIMGGSVTGWGPALFAALDAQVQARSGIQVMFGTTAQELVQDPVTGEILGVTAQPTNMADYDTLDYFLPITNAASSSGIGSVTGGQASITLTSTTVNTSPPGKIVYIKANKAVALTCGGFMYNEEMKLNFLRLYPFVSYSWKFNTGDGIKMAQKVGAALWHTNFVIGRPTPWYPQNWPGVAGYIGGYPSANNWILVDKHGNRFENEKALPSHSQLLVMGDYDGRACEYTRIPVYVICDSTAIKAGPVATNYSGAAALPQPYGGGYAQWSKDNSVEIAKGWIQQGADIPTLVANLNKPTPASQLVGITPALSPTILAASVSAYNAACTAGVDAQFGTPVQYLAPIATAPFYGWPLWPGCSDNPGGAKRNAMGQVVDPDDNPIPRLYEAGALGCSLGLLYPRGGGFVTDGLTFGRIIGRKMAAEPSWE